eukprot:TRINITY_DN1145_c0_g1_i4.p1 TRINITY_DN1145_c0_g1~~TRINITY_DN1145_c0_g1_i4.p1  ORF type:complete len:262 (+),score=43.82 TRINITY_DN1145_c0_g1_i4:91-876(+)
MANKILLMPAKSDLVIIVTIKQCVYLGVCINPQGQHLYLNNTEGIASECSITKIEETFTKIVYPSDFVSRAKYLGVDEVAFLECDHFYAQNVRLDNGRSVDIDAWVTQSSTAVPCQISVTDKAASTVTVWAFDGFTEYVPETANAKCGQILYSCIEDNYVCQVKEDADMNEVYHALSWVCSDGKVDCTPIRPGGSRFYPDTLVDHANWAYNEYYQRVKKQQGPGACSFGHTAHLVDPDSQVVNSRNVLFSTFLEVNNFVCP